MDNTINNDPPTTRRPGGVGNARLGLILFSLNILLVATLIGSYVRPSLFDVYHRQPASPDATPTTGAFDVGALPGPSPTSAPIRTRGTATATTRPRVAPTATHALPTATPATPTPPPTVAVTPTPCPTVSNGGG